MPSPDFDDVSGVLRPKKRGKSLGKLLGLSTVLGLGLVAWIKLSSGKMAPPPGRHSAVPAGDSASLRQKVERLTGGHTRVVWARDFGHGKDTFANGTELQLMGLDTREPNGERPLVPGRGNFSRPLLSPDGSTVFFSRREATGAGDGARWQSTIHAVAWQGGPPRRLRSGYAVDAWRDPDKGEVWVYALTTLRDGIGANPEGYRLFRFRADDPGSEEVVWEHGLINGDNLQLNRAGTAASGLIPWPNAGTFDFTSGQFIRYRNGCWPSLAPDDSGVVWVFDGTHENLRLFLPGVDGNWRVPMESVESLKGKAAYHPRWSNDPRIISFTGPHPVKVAEGSGKVSVILARFNANLTGLEESVSLRNASGEPDCYPDVWVAEGEQVNLAAGKIGSKRVQELAAMPRAAAAAWTAAPEGLCFVWERSTANNQISATPRECSVTPQRHARYGPQFDLLTEGGAFVVDEASAAAIREALAGREWSMELAVTPLAPGNPQPQVIFRAGPAMELQQSQVDFIIRTGLRDWVVGAGLSAGRTTHLVLGNPIAPDGPPVVWMNGQAQPVIPLEEAVRDALPHAVGTEVQFGSRADASAAWAGRLEGVAFHARPLDPVVASGHASWWKDRLTKLVPAPRTVVRAKLKEASPRATPDSIGAYRRSWTSAVYEKTALISGPDPGAVFGVAHWTLLDRTLLTGPPGTPGEERELILEAMADHPEMDSEHGSEEILAGDQRLFLDMAPPGQ